MGALPFTEEGLEPATERPPETQEAALEFLLPEDPPVLQAEEALDAPELTRIIVPLRNIRYCQDSCGRHFRNGESLQTTVDQLVQGSITVDQLKIRVVGWRSDSDIYFCLDNRRLRCVHTAFPADQYASLEVPVLLASLKDPAIRKEWQQKFTVGQRIPYHNEVKAPARQRRRSSAGRTRSPAEMTAQRDQQNQTSTRNGESVEALHSHGKDAGQGLTAAQDGKLLMCSTCNTPRPKSLYSMAQLKKKDSRRCKACVHDPKEATTKQEAACNDQAEGNSFDTFREEADGQPETVHEVFDAEDERAPAPLFEKLLLMCMQDGLIPNYTDPAKRDVTAASLEAQGFRGLHVAAATDHAACEALIHAAADVNAKHGSGKMTPLHMAIHCNNELCCIALLAARARVDSKEYHGRTPLNFAAEDGNMQICKLLLAMSASVNSADKEGDTVLAMAASRVRQDICVLLIERQADFQCLGKADKVALLASVAATPHMLEKLLASFGSVNIRKPTGATALHIAGQEGLLQATRSLISARGDVRALRHDGVCPLYLAACQGHVSLCRCLLEAEADVTSKDNDDQTPLFGASIAGQVEACKLLLAWKADPHFRSRENGASKDARTCTPAQAVMSSNLEASVKKATLKVLLETMGASA
eukprot:TRINITY_DN102028_c0_g1_i1.p1 TRINITY_DN102028_c0_g1~~TRINITY_DN102028_c0_g1_i1.p1  ORF type:complete len:665 (+),score=69.78 TRINITY_DN102028_c0_g1_i1:58-1995(+)